MKNLIFVHKSNASDFNYIFLYRAAVFTNQSREKSIQHWDLYEKRKIQSELKIELTIFWTLPLIKL